LQTEGTFAEAQEVFVGGESEGACGDPGEGWASGGGAGLQGAERFGAWGANG